MYVNGSDQVMIGKWMQHDEFKTRSSIRKNPIGKEMNPFFFFFFFKLQAMG